VKVLEIFAFSIWLVRKCEKILFFLFGFGFGYSSSGVLKTAMVV
jgi:hypothetical protein